MESIREMRSTLNDFLSQQQSTSAPSTSSLPSSLTTSKAKAPYKIPRIQQTPVNETLQLQLQELMADIGPIRRQKQGRRCYVCNEFGHTSHSCPLNNSSSSRSMPTSTSINQGTFRLASHELAELARRFSHHAPIMQLMMALAIFFKQTADNMKR